MTWMFPEPMGDDTYEEMACTLDGIEHLRRKTDTSLVEGKNEP